MKFLAVLFLVLPAPVTIGIVVLIVGLIAFAVISIRAAKRREDKLRLEREQAAAVKRQQEEDQRRKKQAVERRAAAVAAEKRKHEERACEEEKRLVVAVGKHGAGLMKRARSSVEWIMATEAAQGGWLGEVNFVPDLVDIEDTLAKAQALQRKTEELSALPAPGEHDHSIVAKAKSAKLQLERKAKEQVKLLEKCAAEARQIDEIRRQEREEAATAAKREELHGDLAALLYVTEATGTAPADSTADAVLARVEAFKDIRGQVELARMRGADSGDASKVDTEDSWLPAPLRDAWKWIVE